MLTAPNIWASKTFAGYQLIDPQFLLRLPTDVPQSHLLMAQQLGTVVFGTRKLPSLVGKTVAILGQGSVGLFHDFMLRRIGAHRIIAIEPVKERREHAERMGVDDVIDVTGQRATDAVLDLTDGEGADLVVEGVGSTDTLNQSLQLVKPLGRVAGLRPAPDDGQGAVRLGHVFQEAPGLAHCLRRTGRARTAGLPARRGLHQKWRDRYGAVRHSPVADHEGPGGVRPGRCQGRRCTESVADLLRGWCIDNPSLDVWNRSS